MNFFKKKPDYQPKATEIQIPLVTINPYGNILFSNNSANNLFQVNNAVNKNITDFIKADLPSIIAGSSNSVRKAFAVALPEEKFVEITSKEVQSENYFILTFMEVTKDYVLMNKLIEYRTNMDNLGKNKNLFLAQMSNAFKSPMHSIMGYSRAILEGMGGETDEKQQKYLNIIYTQSEELFKLLDRLTELSKIEAQMISFSYKNYDLTNLLNAIHSEFFQKSANKGLQFYIDTENLIQKVIYGDDSALGTVLGYLIENALMTCDFGSVGLVISDKEYKEKGENFIKIKVTDTSTPIKQSEMPYLFNPYYQPDKKKRSTLIKSLNLCIAGNLIGQMNGKMSAETDVSGFTVVIPTDKKVETVKVE